MMHPVLFDKHLEAINAILLRYAELAQVGTEHMEDLLAATLALVAVRNGRDVTHVLREVHEHFESADKDWKEYKRTEKTN